jgi:MFS family permease
MTAYKRYVLATLTVVFGLNYLDRCLLILLLQPIKIDLHLSDTQLGLLAGPAFGLFYAVLGIPMARWADRGDRSTLTAIAIALWGATMMLCVLLRNFGQLLATRVLASVGEAGCMPPTYSLIGDYFPGVSERNRALAVYWLASPLAALTSFFAGGWLSERYGWRFTFFVMGIPGILVAVLVKLTIRETRTASVQRAQRRPVNNLMSVLALLWSRPSLRHLAIAIVLFFTLAQGLNPWYAAFLTRSHGMGVAELGVTLGSIFGAGGFVGILSGAYLIGQRFAHDVRAQMSLSALALSATVPLFILFLLVPQKQGALLALVPLIVVFNCTLGPTFALLQGLVPENARATTLAVIMLAGNLMGIGVGPALVGALSDLFQPLVGADSLRYGMLAMSLVGGWTAYHFWRAGRHVVSEWPSNEGLKSGETADSMPAAAESGVS